MMNKDELIRFEKEREALEIALTKKLKKVARFDTADIVDITEYGIDVGMEYYCCGETEYDSYTFPWEFVAMTDDEFATAYKAQQEAEAKAKAEAKRIQNAEDAEKRRISAAKAERATYEKLKAKFENNA